MEGLLTLNANTQQCLLTQMSCGRSCGLRGSPPVSGHGVDLLERIRQPVVKQADQAPAPMLSTTGSGIL